MKARKRVYFVFVESNLRSLSDTSPSFRHAVYCTSSHNLSAYSTRQLVQHGSATTHFHFREVGRFRVGLRVDPARRLRNTSRIRESLYKGMHPKMKSRCVAREGSQTQKTFERDAVQETARLSVARGQNTLKVGKTQRDTAKFESDAAWRKNRKRELGYLCCRRMVAFRVT